MFTINYLQIYLVVTVHYIELNINRMYNSEHQGQVGEQALLPSFNCSVIAACLIVSFSPYFCFQPVFKFLIISLFILKYYKKC